MTVAASVGLASLPAQSQEAPALTGIGHTLSAKGDGVDNRQSKELKRIDADLPGYCF